MISGLRLIWTFVTMLAICKSFKINSVRHCSKLCSTKTTDASDLHIVESRVLDYLSNSCKIAANSYILISVSGGVDSMALLHILSRISQKKMPLNLEVISFNHKLREESDEEVIHV